MLSSIHSCDSHTRTLFFIGSLRHFQIQLPSAINSIQFNNGLLIKHLQIAASAELHVNLQ